MIACVLFCWPFMTDSMTFMAFLVAGLPHSKKTHPRPFGVDVTAVVVALVAVVVVVTSESRNASVDRSLVLVQWNMRMARMISSVTFSQPLFWCEFGSFSRTVITAFNNNTPCFTQWIKLPCAGSV